MKIQKIFMLLVLIISTNYAQGAKYYESNIFFHKYYEIQEKKEKGFYIQYEKIDKIDKFSLFNDSKLIKSRTEEITTNGNKKIIHYNSENVKKTEEIYNIENNKIKETTYNKKGKTILQSINYFYKDNDLVYQELKIMNLKPKLIYYEKNFDGRLYKISGANMQIWNYGTANELKSTYFDINKNTTKTISYDESARSIHSAIFLNNTLKSRETNVYQNENETLSTEVQGDTKIFSKFLNSNLMKEEVFVSNKLKKTSIYSYNPSGIAVSEEIILNEGQKKYKTKTEYDYNTNNKLKVKKIYENGIISLKTTYLSDDEMETELYDGGLPMIKLKYKGETMIEEQIINKNGEVK